MNILDIDLDFFLEPRPTRRAKNDRLSPWEFHPWSRHRVDDYLSTRCNLSKERRLPGAVVTYHHELFDRWKSLITSGRLRVPFHLTHIDAHADMGMGDASCGYIMGELLHHDPRDRVDPKRGGHEGLLESNFISFAVACRWIERITYVHHLGPRYNKMGIPDISPCLFRDNDPRSGVIQLKKLPRGCHNDGQRLTEFTPLELEPEIPLQLVDRRSFSTDASFAFVFAAQSPNYTPATADPILDTIRQFIDDED